MSAASEQSQNPGDASAPLISAGPSDRCGVCGAHLAVDQRYCVECGTRRGAPRFQLAGQSVAASAAAPVPAGGASGGLRRLTRVTSGTALLVTVLIILVAVGVGVLIGHDGSNHTVISGTPRVVINDSGSGGGTAAATGNSGAASTGSSSASGSSSGSGTKAKSKSTPAASKATKAAASATNSSASAKGKSATSAAAKSFSKSATDKSTVGGSCAAGTNGCTNGKQTGNLF